MPKLPAFTLVEVILASSIFAVVGLIAVTVFVNVIRTQKRVTLENAVYEDARFMMERMSRDIRKNTVDYEEYYNKFVENQPYGAHYGCYATRFYDRGSDNAFGALCNDGSSPSQTPGCVIDQTTLDKNTGQNPFTGNSFLPDHLPAVANAFCDKNFANGLDPTCGDPTSEHNAQSELYLIDGKGTQKTFFARKTVNALSEHALAILKLDGEDADKDGMSERWVQCVKNDGSSNPLCCAKDFDCSQIPSETLESTLLYDPQTSYKGFVPISPSRTDVVSLQFYIAPVEDPRKAFAEDGADIQQQPHVTILLTVQPSKSALADYNGIVPTITLETTITSRVYNEVKSYYGAGVCTNY